MKIDSPLLSYHIDKNESMMYTGVLSMIADHFPEPYWGLDPPFSIPTSWHIRDIKSMDHHPLYSTVLLYHAHPITQIQIQGTVVQVMVKQKYIKYTIDDTTDIIKCITWNNCIPDPMDYLVTAVDEPRPYPIGTHVSIIGTIQKYNNELELSISTIEPIINNPLAELLWHKEANNRKLFLKKNPPINPNKSATSFY